LEEYLNGEDIGEATLCATELQTALAKNEDKEVGLFLLVSNGLNLGSEKRSKDRDLLTNLLVHMHEEKVLSKDDISAGFKDALEFAEDMLIDCPKLLDYYAATFAKLALNDAIGLDYLSTSATEPLKPERREGFTALVLKAVQALAPDKLVDLYKESGLELSSVLQSSTSASNFLKEQDLTALISVTS